ncbi:hypothetical protein [Tautonia rosea]|uniref:hypothetical protein n=1 Tax=Tautonia rosea TaxID=2728037 RepID=UPI001475E3E7|nr:hypothetical protein [Tautonia rosea]
MNAMTYFERLLVSAERIAHHPWHPSKDETIAQCIEEIEMIALDGHLSDAQYEQLRAVLRSGCSNAA